LEVLSAIITKQAGRFKIQFLSGDSKEALKSPVFRENVEMAPVWARVDPGKLIKWKQ
jgi:hypothetical protein